MTLIGDAQEEMDLSDALATLIDRNDVTHRYEVRGSYVIIRKRLLETGT